MKIKIENKYLKRIKEFKSNKYLKRDLIPLIKKLKKDTNITFYNIIKKVPGINSSTAYFLLAQNGFTTKNHSKEVFKYFSILNNSLNRLINENNINLFNTVFNERKKNIKKKISLKNYSGNRHKSSLPVRGQRTSTNARTRKKFKII